MKIYEHPDFYLPNLYTFQNMNTNLASFHGLRFRVTPEAEGKDPPHQLTAETWLGEYCLEKSTITASASFPCDEEGYRQVLDWLDEQYNLQIGIPLRLRNPDNPLELLEDG